MAEFKLGRIRFVWKGDWNPSTTYYIDDVIRYGARTYICAVGHTSAADFNTDLEYSPTKWNQMSDGQSWTGDWSTSTFYRINDVVKYGGLLYICNDSHTSAAIESTGLEADQSKWTLYAEGLDWKDDWSTATRYKVNDVVRYGGYTYVCNEYHTSAATSLLGLEADQSKWDEFNQGIEYKGNWVTATRYKVNDVVKYGAGSWICSTQHVADAAFLTDSTAGRWSQFIEGNEFESTWNSSTLYQPGDIVSYGGNQYVSKTVHTAATSADTPPATAADWDLFSEGLKYQSNWSNSTSYKIGEVVTRNGNAYVATVDSPSNAYTVTASNTATDIFTTSSTAGMVAGMSIRFAGVPFGGISVNSRYYVNEVVNGTTFKITDSFGGPVFNLTTASGTMTATVSAEPPNSSYWSVLSSGIYWRGAWEDDVEYNVGDAVRLSSNAYVCINSHRSEQDDGSTIGTQGGGAANSRPDLDTTGTYWSLLSIGSETDILSVRGDLVYYGGSGPTRLPVGREGQILRSNGTDPEWATLGEVDHVYFVATHGTDSPAPIYGKTFDKPWKTIRYACEQVEQGPMNPEAKKLLELNRVFIQREVTEFIQNQITNNIAPFTSAFVYDDFKCERDVGFVIDALIYDIGHGGNIKSRGAANSLIGGLSEEETESYPGLTLESEESVAAYNYMLEVVEDVLTQTAPAVNYQTLNGDNSTATVAQYFDADLEAESGTYTTIQGLVGIITDAITARAAASTPAEIAAALAAVPARRSPSNLIRVATGQYREVLPIIVPEQTCVQGDELRSTNAGPGTGTTNISDAMYSVGALTRMETVVGEIITGADVTESSGNTEIQSIAFPYASSEESTTIKQLVRTIQHNIDFRLNANILASYTLPTGYNTAYLNGYGDARTLIKENRQFAKSELIAFIAVNYPNVKYSKTKCKRDVGYIIDALIYDLTYGGNSQSVNAALAYFDGPGSEFAGIFGESTEEVTATIASYQRLKTILQQIAANTTVTRTNGNTDTQWTDSTNLTGGSAASSFIGSAIDIIINILTTGATTAAPSITVTSITGSNTAVTGSAHGLAAGDTFVPRTTANGFVKNRKYWVLTAPSGTEFTVSTTFGGSTHTLTNGTGLSIVGDVTDTPPATNGVTSTTALITAAQTLDAAQETIVQNVVDDLNAVAWHTDFVVDDTSLTTTQFRIYVGKHTLAHTYVSGGTVTKSDETVLNISNFVYNESTGYAIVTTTTHGLEAGDIVDIEDITVSCLSSGGSPVQTVFPSSTKTDGVTPKIRYLQHKCLRDTRLILEAVMYDFMFNSNVQTKVAGYSYLRSTASDVYDLNQKTITRDALANAKTEALANVGGDTTAQARIESLMTLLDDIVFSGSTEGSRCASGNRMIDYAVLQLERNRSYIVAEIDAYIDSTYTTTVTNATASTDLFTCSSTAWMQRGTAIRFSGTVFGGINTETTYYVQNVVSSTTFKITTTRGSNAALDITSDSAGSMTVKLHYNSDLCLRDVNSYIDALKFDLKFPGNYKSLMSARYYANAVVGSLEEDMYYLRDATGIRDQTLQGLTGDLLAPNSIGTSRVSAGAYCSLDPGWGPEDYRTWIITRSPYVQGVTTFGTACIGQKIDGALHNGGNDSIVSNDFTQVLSDGIGAWVDNNGRAELVSVFTYYGHIGYLATNGGRIRGTNGNCSYGDFGAVAEGFDTSETPNTAIVDNRFQFNAVVDRIVTDGSGLLQFEFTNAGIDYTEAEYVITGGGLNGNVVNDEFRDDAVFEVRMLDLVDDSTNAEEADGNFGGFGYITNSNTAQGGSSTSITIAATDSETSTAYVGMKVVLTGGAGVGQFGIITSYNSGTKVANVVKESTGVAGWDHMIPGTTIANPDASTTYIIEPRVTFSAPAFTAAASILPSSGTWSSAVYGETAAVYTSLSGTYSGSGAGATFTVIRNGWKYTPSLQTAGTGYTRLQTITIAGNNLGGTAVTNDLVITITAVNSVTGAILEFDHSGSGAGGRYVAVRSGSTNAGAYSNDGISWTGMTLPSTGSWTSVTHGLIDDGSSVGKVSRFVAVRSGSTAAAYSADGITWTASTLPSSASWTSVAYGNGRFVAISSGAGGNVAVSLDGETWDITSSLTDSGYTEVAYGRGLFVAIRTATTDAQTSPDGVTWTARTLPAADAWISVTWGNNKFVAVASDSNDGAISLDGATWTAVTLGSVDSSTAGYQKVRYGQGLFMATVYKSGETGYSFCVTSEDGLTWNEQSLPDNGGSIEGYNALAFGNPQRTGRWVALQYASGTHAVSIRTGARAKGRALVAANKLFQVNITEPGSGYNTTPTITFTDPNNTFEAPTLVRKGSGVLANPTFINRGSQYVTSNAEIDTGDGYADLFQPGAFVAVRQITERPVPGSNVVFGHLPDRTFKLVNVITFLGTNDGGYTAFFQISPNLTISEAPAHETSITTRLRYSQVRLTGHDFLDIGTGNFEDTNYPGLPTQDPIPANETVEGNGGRVFFTATDQDGNFRVGDLFNIEQSTGIATLNADAFNISGLQELNLGNVTLGGGSATITEFSTDPFFTADSDNIVPTQRAIKAFIASQIGGGGASLNVNSVTAGSIFISSNVITTTTGGPIKMNATFEFRGGVIGLPLAFNYFLN
jgi:hypothetical protein